MAKGFVNELKAVDVDDQYRAVGLCFAGPGSQSAFEPLLEQNTIGKPGQIVVESVVKHVSLGLAFARTVGHCPHKPGCSAGGPHWVQLA